MMITPRLAPRYTAAVGRWPLASGVVNVKAFPYFAAGDGQADDTAAIQQAILDNEGRGRTIYLPEGVYLVSAPLKFSANTTNSRMITKPTPGICILVIA